MNPQHEQFLAEHWHPFWASDENLYSHFIADAKKGSPHVGLSEIAVFKSEPEQLSYKLFTQGCMMIEMATFVK